MATLRAQKKRVYQRAIITCRKCATSIPLQKLNALSDEFSVRCPRCGDRGIYAKRAITIEDLPERRKKSRD